MLKKNVILVLLVGIMTLNFFLLRDCWLRLKTDSRILPARPPTPPLAAIPLVEQFSNIPAPAAAQLPAKNKLILLWTKSWSKRTKPISGWDISESTLSTCPFKCDFTDDKERLEETDALVYHGVSWNEKEKLPDLPDRGSNWDQIWTFFRIESPIYYVHDFSKFDNQFNWTSTYRMDSDVPYVYGRFEKYSEEHEHSAMEMIPTEASISNKSLIAWMNSHCQTNSFREVLVRNLQKFVPVDIFGKCGPKAKRLTCQTEECYRDFSKKYKFWLSFENSLCTDYVTEKFYNPLLFGMVPVLYADKSVTRLIPKDSFVNVSDFSSVEELAKYLKFLDENPEEYLKYFEWRKYLRVSRDNRFWCSFCTKLYSSKSKNEPKFYPSVHEWYYRNHTEQHQCKDPSGPLFD